VSSDTGLSDIEQLAIEGTEVTDVITPGAVSRLDHRSAYVQHLLGCLDTAVLKPLRIVCNPGNGTAGAIIDRLCEHLPVEVIRMQWEPDGSFPNGVPNPLLAENRGLTREMVLESGADLGLAWDGDFDRCFFFDGNGRFIEGYYLVGLLAEVMLARQPGAKIVHDPRLTWNTVDVVARVGGNSVVTKTGHAYIKERMRLEDAVYGGEMSAHHYFKDFFYCDSGMLPWLLVYELMSRKDVTLAQLVDASMANYPCSGELNFTVADSTRVLLVLERRYAYLGRVDRTDGLSVDFENWRFNVRVSNTEPLLRLNVETRADAAELAARTEELAAIIKECAV
jgi:phosphomannomutase